MSFRSNEYDAIVVGAGPGGSATASILGRGGASVLHLERDAQPRFKIGESLMPETYGTFEKMGVLEALRSSPFVQKHSVQFYSAKGRASSPFYFDSVNPTESAQTWQVLRSEFDDLLFRNGEKYGVECRRGVNVREIVWEGDRATGVRGRDETGKPFELRSRVVVDATGQSSLIAKKLELQRVDYGIRKASIFTHFQGAYRDQGRDEGATLILQTADAASWFWYIPLPNDVVSVGVVGDADQLFTERDTAPHETFFERVGQCAEIQKRIEGAVQCRPVQVLRDFSYRSPEVAGDGWVLVGDAFSFIDPVYSSGVFLALKSGELAAEAILEGLRDGDLSKTQLGRIEAPLQDAMGAVLRLVRAFYAPSFSIGGFLKQFPEHQLEITRILVGDVMGADFSKVFADMDAYEAQLVA